MKGKYKATLVVCLVIVLSAVAILPSQIRFAKAGTTSKFINPPYYWLIKVTNIFTWNATITGYFSQQELYDPQSGPYPLEPFAVTCEEFPQGANYIVLFTAVVPDDLHFNVDIWFAKPGDPWYTTEEQEHYVNTFTFARQYPKPQWPLPAYAGLPHFPIPFHYEWDIYRGMLAPASLVSLDIEPLYNFDPLQTDWYNTTAGEINSCGCLTEAWHRREWDTSLVLPPKGGVPFATRAPYLTPNKNGHDIVFSAVDGLYTSNAYPNPPWSQMPGFPGMVYFTVPALTYKGLNHTYWSYRLSSWFMVELKLPEDGYGWIFTQVYEGQDNPYPDVDMYTNNTYYETIKYEWSPAGGFVPIGFHQTSIVYWVAPSPAGDGTIGINEIAAYRGGLPDIGPDLVPGTDDDGFGDGILDPVGSSIMYLPTILQVSYTAEDPPFGPLFASSFPFVGTTGVSQDLVGPPPGIPSGGSSIYDCWAGDGHPEMGLPHTTAISAPHGRALQGQPWEFLQSGEAWGTNLAKKFVIYVGQYSVLGVATSIVFLDVAYDFVVCMVKQGHETEIIGDGTGSYGAIHPPGTPSTDFKVGWQDLFSLAAAYGATDESYATRTKVASQNYDARFDTNSAFGPQDSKIGWQDLFALAGHYGNDLYDEWPPL